MDLILACHVKNNNWYKLINHNLSKIVDYCNNIYIVYSISDNNIDSNLFEKQIVYKNVILIKVENEGYDFKKYKIGLSSMILSSNSVWNDYLNRYPDLKTAFGDNIIAAEKHWYEHGKAENRICQLNTKKSVILMNDSFIFSRNIDDIMNKIQEKINNNVTFIGLSRSYEQKEHYQSYFWVLNYNLIPILCNLLTPEKLNTDKGCANIINNCEVGISNLFINRYKSEFIYHTNNNNCLLDGLHKLLNNGYPIIKLLCLKKAKYDSDAKYKIKDFVPEIYMQLHSQLKHMNKKELTEHFFNHGIIEGRKYKYDQKSYIPQGIKNFLDNTGLQYEILLD